MPDARPDPTPDDPNRVAPLAGDPAAEVDDRTEEQRVKDELDRIFLANMEASEAPWKTWRKPAEATDDGEAGAWWKPFLVLGVIVAVALLVVLLAG